MNCWGATFRFQERLLPEAGRKGYGFSDCKYAAGRIPYAGIQVYVTRTLYQGQWYNSLTNVGICPTCKNDMASTVETHMIGFEQELYGQDIEVS